MKIKKKKRLLEMTMIVGFFEYIVKISEFLLLNFVKSFTNVVVSKTTVYVNGIHDLFASSPIENFQLHFKDVDPPSTTHILYDLLI